MYKGYTQLHTGTQDFPSYFLIAVRNVLSSKCVGHSSKAVDKFKVGLNFNFGTS